MEFACEGETVYLTRFVIDAVAKMLLMTRRVELDFRISRVEISSPKTPAAR